MLTPTRPRSLWSRLGPILLIAMSLSFMDKAHTATVVAPRITVLDVSPTDHVTTGTPLSIRVEGTARGQASARINGVARTIVLKEVQDGIYEGDYTIRNVDKLPQGASVVATLRIAKRSTTSTLPGGLTVAGVPSAAAPVVISGPVITRFVSTPVTKLEPGVDLTFAVEGSPKAKVVVKIPGVARELTMEEVATGRYEASYTVRQSDKLAVDARATARLTLAGKTAESTLTYALTSTPAATPADAAIAALPLKITSHEANATVPSGPVTVSGTTLPGAAIDVSVVANASFGGLGLNQNLLKERVEADAKGNFSFQFRPPVAVKGVRYDITLSGYKGAQTGSTTLSLTQKK